MYFLFVLSLWCAAQVIATLITACDPLLHFDCTLLLLLSLFISLDLSTTNCRQERCYFLFAGTVATQRADQTMWKGWLKVDQTWLPEATVKSWYVTQFACKMLITKRWLFVFLSGYKNVIIDFTCSTILIVFITLQKTSLYIYHDL